jgi:uncharacterized protein
MISQPQIGFGQVRHRRLKPRRNAFSHASYFLLLPMRTLARASSPGDATPLPINRRGVLSFFDSDHGDGRGPERGGALAWLDETLHQAGIGDARGEVWLQCFPRVLGFTFKPVSFWFCHRATDDQQGSLRAIVVEVNNTFGERHCYLLDSPRPGALMHARKVFHVSPFLPLDGQYGFRFLRTEGRSPDSSVARIDYGDEAGPVLQTSVSGRLEPLTSGALRRAFWFYPFFTWGVIVRIHWQALKLWSKGVRFHSKPSAPATALTR